MLPRLVAVAAFAFGLGIAMPTILYSQTGPFQPGANPVSNQAWSAVAVTPNDSTIIAPTRALYNGASPACTIVVTTNGASVSVTFQNVQPGEIIPVQAIKVGSGSTCTGIIALY
jgi:hypothetical protein